MEKVEIVKCELYRINEEFKSTMDVVINELLEIDDPHILARRIYETMLFIKEFMDKLARLRKEYFNIKLELWE